jgi:hypothetical protein
VAVAGIRVVGSLVTQSIGPSGGEIALADTGLLLSVPAEALNGRSVSVQIGQVAPNSVPPAPDGGFKIGTLSLQVTLVDLATDQPLSKLAAPLALTYTIPSDDLSLAGGQATRVHWAEWLGQGWQALPCGFGGDSSTLTCSLASTGLIADVVAPTPGATLDWDVPNGHFFMQANGFGGAGTLGYTVADDSDALFWTEFQRLGGVQVVGYPISGRFQFKGFTTQGFQKLALQWRPDLNQVVPLNVLDEANLDGADPWLDSMRQVPPADDTSADTGLSFQDVVNRHTALLDAYPALADFYASTPDAIDIYGLPLAVKSYGPVVVVVRLQRATLQLWQVDTPFAQAGSVVAGNGSDLAKEIGLWPPEATLASSPAAPPPNADPVPPPSVADVPAP